MRRMICILAALLICTGSVAYAGEHIGIQGVFSGVLNDKTVTIDLFEQDDERIVLSSLFPDQAVSANAQDCPAFSDIGSLFLIHPARINNIAENIKGVISSWLEAHNCCSEDGIYAGALFEKSASVRTAEFLLSDFLLFAEHSLRDNSTEKEIPGQSRNDNQEILSFVLQWIRTFLPEDPLRVFVRRYDNGTYSTVTVMQKDDVIMTLSVHSMSENGKRFLISYKENGRYVFNDIIMTVCSDSFSAINKLYCSNVSSFSTAEKEQPMIHDQLILTAINEKTCSFNYISEPRTAEEAVTVAGTISQDVIRADFTIKNIENGILSVTASRESVENKTAYQDFRVIHAEKADDLMTLQMEVFSAVLTIMAELIPTLPASYQQMVLYLLQN